MKRNENLRNFCVWYSRLAVVHFTDQNWILKTLYCRGCVMVFKIGFTNWNTKIALLPASMVVTYYIKLFRTEADRHNGILMSLILLVAETLKSFDYCIWLWMLWWDWWILTTNSFNINSKFAFIKWETINAHTDSG